MKKLLLLLTLLSCEKPQVVNCYTCNQRVSVNYRDTFRSFRECGTSKEAIEKFHTKSDGRGNETYTKCRLEK